MIIVSLIVLMIVIFGGLIFFIKHLLTRNIASATTHLQGMMKDYSAKQEDAQKKFEEAQNKSNELLTRAKKEAEELKEKYKKELEEERSRVLEEAHRQSEELIDRANKTCESRKAELDKNINERAGIKAGELICKVLPPELCQVMHKEWINALIAEGLSGIDRLRIPDNIEKLEITTAIALTGEQKKALNKKLEEKLGKNFEIDEKIDSGLVAGMIVILGNLVFDGSFASKIQEITRESAGK